MQQTCWWWCLLLYQHPLSNNLVSPSTLPERYTIFAIPHDAAFHNPRAEKASMLNATLTTDSQTQCGTTSEQKGEKILLS